MIESLVALADRALAAARALSHEHRGPSDRGKAAPFPYIAPELTGRTGHAVDQRADLYALGAALYGWATGKQPFEQSDPLQLVHDQLTRAPVPPLVLRPDLPPALSDIILRLLEKEPERRYQSAEGLAHDLQRVRRALVRGHKAAFDLGERDFPHPLRPPVRPVGHARQLDALAGALASASRGECRVVMLGGPAGTGKSALVNELRPLVAARHGRFVAGHCSPYGEQDTFVTAETFRALGRLLLAEPEDELALLKREILAAIGPNAGLLCAAAPEFRLLLGELPQPPAADTAYQAVRLRNVALDLLRVVASPQRPLVMVLEDLQWALDGSVDFIEGATFGEGMPGLLLVGTWRNDELPQDHPLGGALQRWRAEGRAFDILALENLPEADVAQLLSEVLRLPRNEAARLASRLGRHTHGNPRDTLELVNALRRDGVLAPRARGWRWNADEIDHYMGGKGVVDLLTVRIARLPRAARELLEALACLRHDVELEAAAVATGTGLRELQASAARLADDGMLLREAPPSAPLRLQEPVRRAAYDGMDDSRRVRMHIDIARRLAPHPRFEGEAASQYHAAAQVLGDPQECGAAAELLHRHASRMAAAANNAGARQLLRAAITLLQRAAAAGQGNASLQVACELDLHLAMCRLGNLDEADDIYARIESRRTDPLALAASACAQVTSLHDRGRTSQAVAHGLQYLRRLRFDTREHLDSNEAAATVESLRNWVARFDADAEIGRQEAADPRVVAAANMFARLGPCCFYARTHLACSLVRESVALWEAHGPSPGLAVTLCLAGLVCGTAGDWRTGYLAGRRIVDFCEAKGWEPACSQARQLFSICSSHWFDPVEHGLEQAVLAREGLLACGDLQGACFSYRVSMVKVFDCAATLDDYAHEVDAGLDLARRSGVHQLATALAAARQLLRSLRGETAGAGAFDDAEFSESRHLAENASTPMVMVGYHLYRGLAGALFGDRATLCAHARAGVALMIPHGFYAAAWAHWLAALGTAWELQEPQPGRRPKAARLAELERALDWLGRRAVDAPANFRHLYLHLLAEHAWARADIAGAETFFESAMDAASRVARPWQHALIVERAGRFHRARAQARYGAELLTEARQLYAAWGATAKAAQLAGELGVSQPAAGVLPGGADSLDTIAVLRASQALSSERSPETLRARVEEVLRNITGATKVVLALWDNDIGDWALPAEDGQVRAVQVGKAPHRVPVSALRYAERTAEPLLLADATADDRFSRDSYFQGLERCSVMVVPIHRQGAARALLVLENRTTRGAFSVARLDAVVMIAAQLAVSLENAQLYERLERKVTEQTQQLREAQSRLLAEARRAGMAQIATNVLHNVGNVLTSVNVSVHVVTAQVRQSPASRIGDLSNLLVQHADDLPAFFAPGGRGRRLPGYLRELADTLGREQDQLLTELSRLRDSVDHIKNVVAMQQSYAGAGRLLEPASMADLVDDALRIQEASLSRHLVEVQRDYSPVPVAALDKTRVMQILVNLLENARQAMSDVHGERRIRIAVRQEASSILVSVRDCGCGISADNLQRIFSHGFTTKADGHGFGLHSCAIAAQEMGGSLAAHSEGPGTGATFVLKLPSVSVA